MIKRHDRLTPSPQLSVFTLIWRLLLGLWLLLSSSHSVLAGEEVTQFYTDIFGSPVVAIQQEYINGVSTGVIQWRAYREPYGERITPQPDTEQYPLQFTAKSEDFETGLTYFGARYYNAEVGRFYAIDPAGFDPGNIHSLNRYAYANNNPYKYVDPDGRQPFEVQRSLLMSRDDIHYGFSDHNTLGDEISGLDRMVGGGLSRGMLSRIRVHTDAPGAGINGSRVKQHSDGSYRTPNGKFASKIGDPPPGTTKASDFAGFLRQKGMAVVGEELSVKGPLGLRRLDIVVRDSHGKLHGIEVKSGTASKNAYQRFTDAYINQFGAAGTGKLKGETVESINTVKIP